MSLRGSAVCVVLVLLSGLAFLALTSAPVQACDRPPIVIGCGPIVGGDLIGLCGMTAEVKGSKVAVEMALFLVDGVLVAASKTPSTGTTYSAKWNTATVANGEHKLRAAAVLADGSVLNSDAATVTVKNAPPPAAN